MSVLFLINELCEKILLLCSTMTGPQRGTHPCEQLVKLCQNMLREKKNVERNREKDRKDARYRIKDEDPRQ